MSPNLITTFSPWTCVSIHPCSWCMCVGGIHVGFWLKWIKYLMTSLLSHGNIQRLPLNIWRISVLLVIWSSLCITVLFCLRVCAVKYFIIFLAVIIHEATLCHGSTKSSSTHWIQQPAYNVLLSDMQCQVVITLHLPNCIVETTVFL